MACVVHDVSTAEIIPEIAQELIIPFFFLLLVAKCTFTINKRAIEQNHSKLYHIVPIDLNDSLNVHTDYSD